MKKVICTLYHFDNMLNYDFACIDKNGASTIVTSEFGITVNIDTEFTLETLKEKAETVIRKLEILDFNKKPLIINLDLQSIFVERINFPKLSFMEMKKSLNLELDKLYKDFNQRFVNYVSTDVVKNQGYEVTVTACEKNFYAKCLYLLNNCGCKVEKVILAPYALKQFVLENNFYPKGQNFIYINVDKQYTMVIFAKGNKILSHQTFAVGTSFLDSKLANVKDLSIEEARKYRIDNAGLPDIQEVCLEMLEPIIDYIILLGGTYPKEEVYNVRLHSEDYSNEDIVKVLGKTIPSCTLSPVELDMVSKTSFITLATMCNADRDTDPVFPAMVK